MAPINKKNGRCKRVERPQALHTSCVDAGLLGSGFAGTRVCWDQLSPRHDRPGVGSNDCMHQLERPRGLTCDRWAAVNIHIDIHMERPSQAAGLLHSCCASAISATSGTSIIVQDAQVNIIRRSKRCSNAVRHLYFSRRVVVPTDGRCSCTRFLGGRHW